jgi:hypothetical protein
MITRSWGVEGELVGFALQGRRRLPPRRPGAAAFFWCFWSKALKFFLGVWTTGGVLTAALSG